MGRRTSLRRIMCIRGSISDSFIPKERWRFRWWAGRGHDRWRWWSRGGMWAPSRWLQSMSFGNGTCNEQARWNVRLGCLRANSKFDIQYRTAGNRNVHGSLTSDFPRIQV